MKNIWFAVFWIMIGLTIGFIIGNRETEIVSIDNISQPVAEGTANTNQNAGSSQKIPAKTTIDDDPYLGDKSQAKIGIVEFSDYECPFCKKFHDETFDQIVKEYVDTGKAIIVYRDFPLSFHDPAATQDASAANCVQEIAGDKKYFEMNKLIFERGGLNGVGITDEKFYELATEIGISKDEFTECFGENKFQDEIRKDLSDGQTTGINGTPGFVIGKLSFTGEVSGQMVSGAQPFSVFQKIIEEELAK